MRPVKAAARGRIEKAIAKGPYSVHIGERSITIRERRGRYEIIVEDGDDKPAVWIYRKRPIAIDRFEEQCDYYRRGSKPKENK
jgi:hypothetical protein